MEQVVYVLLVKADGEYHYQYHSVFSNLVRAKEVRDEILFQNLEDDGDRNCKIMLVGVID
jgi:hypothetical protein